MQLPERIGKYELLEYLGGGMSHVYRAIDTIINRTVAVKILTEQGCADEEVRARFLQEGRTAGGISHENILTIYDFGEDHGRPFMVMEFLRGEDLRHAIKNGHVGDVQNRLKIALSVARAVAFVHSLQIVHRDIKPENIHLSSSGVVKLMDFGIAKSAGMSMTRAGFIVGTPYYMSPEQVQGLEATAKADIYSFGILLYELISGARPFRGSTVEQLFYSIMNDVINIEPLRCDGVPDEICGIIIRCTAKDPSVRFASMDDVCAALEAIIGGKIPPVNGSGAQILAGTPAANAASIPPPQTLPVERPAQTPSPAATLTRRRPKWMIWAAAGLSAVALACSIWYFFPSAKTTSAGSEFSKMAPAPLARITDPGGAMVLVPAGSFKFGASKESITLPSYYIDRTEVTNGAYSDFCRATQRQTPAGFEQNRPDLPVVNVTLADAEAFASWARKRVPTAQEWEKAARGEDGRMYPWGDQPESGRANIKADALMPADSMEQGASPYGALHMLGNAWELTRGVTHPNPRAVESFNSVFKLKPPATGQEAWVSIRGFSYNSNQPIASAVVFESASVPARYHSGGIGFRCVR